MPSSQQRQSALRHRSRLEARYVNATCSSQYSRSNPAAIALPNLRPVALRPHLSMSLPLSPIDYDSMTHHAVFSIQDGDLAFNSKMVPYRRAEGRGRRILPREEHPQYARTEPRYQAEPSAESSSRFRAPNSPEVIISGRLGRTSGMSSSSLITPGRGLIT